VNDADEVTIIDFPQMVSVAHPNGAELFARDVAGVGRFFRKKLGYMPEHDTALPRVAPDFEVRVPASVPARVSA
jgi:RIO kinase 2